MFTNPTEKRLDLRLDFSVPMRYRKIESVAQDFKGSLIKNISKSGAKISLYEFLPLNLRLAIEIPLTSGLKPVQGVGRVAWVSKAAYSEQYDVGLEFVNLNERDSQQITKLFSDQVAEESR